MVATKATLGHFVKTTQGLSCEGLPMDTPGSPTIEELKREIDELMASELIQKVGSAAAAVAAQVERFEMIRSALQTQAATRSRAEGVLLAATERLRDCMQFYRVFERFVRNCLAWHNMVAAMKIFIKLAVPSDFGNSV